MRIRVLRAGRRRLVLPADGAIRAERDRMPDHLGAQVGFVHLGL
ncbi:hypothetical protein [Nocardia sp. NRRL S-836]|nr:hypothetical protein [Nocardia sp. NRRL S-836]